MKKVLDQTVRDLKREVNKKVLKVPSIEQKTLDATSNEPWGPRGSLTAEIAQASCNYNDYQLIMAVLWRRIQDTGKNWRHVYKALSVLEYLAIYGTERVIDDIREHAYQISTLSDFLYTDSNGRDQGSNVRRKSQTLVALVNNKERLQEVRVKAQSNKEKVSRPPLSSSARYNDEHFDGGNREDGLVRGRYLVVRNKDKYRSGDKYGQGVDPYVKDSDRANGENQHGPRSRSVDAYTNDSFDDYDRRSTRSDGSRVDESLRDERIDAPPSYEVAANDSWSDVQNDKGAVTASMQKASSSSGPNETYSRDTNLAPGIIAGESTQAHEKEVVSFDEFDPRGSVSATPTVTSSGSELDIFGLSAVDCSDSSASMPATSTANPDDDMLINSGLGATFVVASTALAVPSEPYENPFGDAPFKAITQEDFPSETNTSASATSQSVSGFVSAGEINLPAEKKMEAAQSYDFGNKLGEPIYSLANNDFYSSEFSAANSSKDILHGILPWTDPVASVSTKETQPSDQSHFLSLNGFSAYSASHAHNSSETGSANLHIGKINPFEQPELSNRLSGQANPFEFQPFQPSPPSEIDANQMNSTEDSALSLPQTLQVVPASSMDRQEKYYLQTSHSTSVPLHAGQSTAPANSHGFQINPSRQQNLSSQAIPPSSRIESHVPQFNNLNQPGLLAPRTPQLPSGPFQAAHSNVPVDKNLESVQLNPLQQPSSSSPSPLGVPVSSQAYRSSDPTIIEAAQINLQPFRPVASQAAQQAIPSNVQTIQSSFTPHSAKPDLITSSSQGSAKFEPSNKKFEPKSTIWADTISRGLVNLNISGPRTNPLADIGIDFDDINRKEKRNEAKSSQTPLPSSFAMGKAMGAGSGLGRAGAGAGAGAAASMGSVMGYMGMGMMHPSAGMPPQQGHGFPAAYNPMNPRGGYGQHQPYGRGG